MCVYRRDTPRHNGTLRESPCHCLRHSRLSRGVGRYDVERDLTRKRRPRDQYDHEVPVLHRHQYRDGHAEEDRTHRRQYRHCTVTCN